MSARDAARLAERLELLQLPVVALEHAGYFLTSRTAGPWGSEPSAVGVGPSGDAWAVLTGPRGRLIVSSGADPVQVLLPEGQPAHFVQPLAGGRFLVVNARARHGGNAEIWDSDGRLERTGDLGDAIEHVVVTAGGAIWVGYFDEAIGARGPAGHGLARFTEDLEPAWCYPHDQGLPPIDDCYALTVAGETVWICAYTPFHLISVARDTARDLGGVPRRSATGLLLAGAHVAQVGGTGAGYDLVTTARLTRDGVIGDGTARRIVRPDGLEILQSRIVCRGADLHVFDRLSWYRTDLDTISAAAGHPWQPPARRPRSPPAA